MMKKNPCLQNFGSQFIIHREPSQGKLRWRRTAIESNKSQSDYTYMPVESDCRRNLYVSLPQNSELITWSPLGKDTSTLFSKTWNKSTVFNRVHRSTLTRRLGQSWPCYSRYSASQFSVWNIENRVCRVWKQIDGQIYKVSHSCYTSHSSNENFTGKESPFDTNSSVQGHLKVIVS